MFSWSYEEIPGIDLSIVEQEKRTHPNVKPVQQNLNPVNPQKATTIKARVEILLKVGFIYPISLT